MILLAVLAGIVAGCITGLTPGLHVNLVAALILSVSLYVTVPAPVATVFVLAMSIVHTFVDAIPALLFGVPDPSFALLPQHRLLHKGLGYEAIKLLTLGGVMGSCCALLLLPFLIVLSYVLEFVTVVLPFIVLGVLVVMIAVDGNKMISLPIVFAAGALGFLVLESVTEPLFVLFTGLFGISGLLLALVSSTSIPRQRISSMMLSRKRDRPVLLLSTLCASCCTMLPGVGSAMAAFLVQRLTRKSSFVSYLLAVGAINTVGALAAMVLWFVVLKARTGALLVVDQFARPSAIMTLVLVVIISVSIGAVLTLTIAKYFLRVLRSSWQSSVCVVLLLLLVALTGLLSGTRGLLALVAASCLGVVTIILGARRSLLMSCLILPLSLRALA
ncbi:hypothetical protein GF342_05725 [Candidatus Woesearchaeota archaeon]|nr:hypothetical protein [Candidatus Woesearchaeota archaeon]